MIKNNPIIYLSIFVLMILSVSSSLIASEKVAVNSGVDLYNRYVWRGLDIANTPSIQPSLSITAGKFEVGTWAAYTLANEASESDEIDFWLGYTFGFENGASLSLLATDYYFPNAGIKFFNFNNHDAFINDTIPDPGAHTIELGASLSLSENFPLTLSGYINVHNDAGNNTYFQADYATKSGDTELNFFVGATGGSKENASYYGSDSFDFINVGVTANKEIKMSENFSLPMTVSFVMNPNDEIAHLLVGVTF